MFKPKSVMTLLGAAGLWTAVAPAAHAHWASYAYSASGDYGFVSYQHLTRPEAEQAALQGCRAGNANQPANQLANPPNTDCRILVSGSRWIAVAETGNQLFWFQEAAQKLVEDGVMRLCRRRQDVEPAQPCTLRMLAHASGGILRSRYRPAETFPPELRDPKPQDIKPQDIKPAEVRPTPNPSAIPEAK